MLGWLNYKENGLTLTKSSGIVLRRVQNSYRAFLVAEFQGSAGHNMVRERESVCVVCVL